MGIEHQARRSLERAGEDAVVTTYSQTGTDDYGDPLFDESTTDVTALFRQPSEAFEFPSSGGVVEDIDVRIYVSSEHSGVINPPTDDAPHPARIARTATGESYTVLGVWDEGNGQLRIDGEAVDR